MSYALRFRHEVVRDLEQASDWYNERTHGLGAEFLRECRSALDRILQQPQHAAADEETGIRTLRLHRFPYVIHYRIEGATIVIFAIMFGGRDPSSWRSRL
jgi:plasmid stabilization system protein ParE